MTREELEFAKQFLDTKPEVALLQTIDASDTELFRVTVPDGRAARIDYKILGKRIGGVDGAPGDCGTYTGVVLVSVEPGGSPVDTSDDSDILVATWTGTISITYSGNDLIFNVNGGGDLTANWKGLFKTVYLDQPIEITSSSPLSDGTVAVPYSETLTNAYGVGDLVWSVVVGSLPDGLTLDGITGEISGTPTVDDVFSFTVVVTDSEGNAASADLEITINP